MGYFAFEGLNFVKCGSKEEFIDSLENVAEKDLLEISIKYVCQMCSKLSRKKKNGNYFKSEEEKKLTFSSKKSIFKSVWTISMPDEWLGPRYNCHSINKYPFLFSFLAWRRRELGTTWYIHI